VSLSLNPRLMAGKPPACNVDAASLQENELPPAVSQPMQACAPDTRS